MNCSRPRFPQYRFDAEFELPQLENTIRSTLEDLLNPIYVSAHEVYAVLAKEVWSR